MNNYEVVELFPTTVYKKNLGALSDINSIIYNTEYFRKEESKCWFSKDFDILEKYPLTKEIIDNEFKFYIKNILCFDVSNIDFFISESWVVKHTVNDFSPTHYHCNSLFSGVLYLSVDDNSGDISFEKDDVLFKPIFNFDVTEWNKYNCITHTIRPNIGDLLIFPSYLKHFVKPSYSSDFRYVLVFNYFFKGTLGKNTCRLKI